METGAAFISTVSRRAFHEKRPWRVLHDPSGDFSGRQFRSADLDRCNNWDNGTVFWNSETGQVRIWRLGKFEKMIPGKKEKA